MCVLYACYGERALDRGSHVLCTWERQKARKRESEKDRVHCTVVKNTILAHRPGSTITPRQDRSLHRSLTVDTLDVLLYLFLYLVHKRTKSGHRAARDVHVDKDYFRLKTIATKCHTWRDYLNLSTRSRASKNRASIIWHHRVCASYIFIFHVFFYMQSYGQLINTNFIPGYILYSKNIILYIF